MQRASGRRVDDERSGKLMQVSQISADVLTGEHDRIQSLLSVCTSLPILPRKTSPTLYEILATSIKFRSFTIFPP